MIFPDWLVEGLAWVIPLVLAITLHEAAHGYMAERYGDNTARLLGRVTLNPLKHIDRFGTVILPGILLLLHSPFLFGYAKAVPVNFHQLRPARMGMFMVAIAGVLVNIALTIASALALHLDVVITPEQAPWLYMNLYHSVLINCVLIIFNMLPILPLDGGRVVASLLHGNAALMFARLERYGIALVILVLLVPPLFGDNLAQDAIGSATYWLVERLLMLTGNGSIADSSI